MDSIEKFGQKWWGMLILISIPVFIVLFPVLLGGYDFAAPESERFQQAFYFYKEAILTADSIFWNPYLFSGFPTFASITGGFLNPITYFAMRFFSVSFAYNWLNFLYFALAGLFTAQLLKKLKVSFWGRYIGGLVFVFSQWSQNHDISVNSSFLLLPLLFLLILNIKDSKGWKYFFSVLIGSIAIGLTWFSSHWHFLVEILFTAAIFSLFLAIYDFYQDKKNLGEKSLKLLKLYFKRYIKAPLGYLLILIGGTLAGLIQIIPTALFIQLSARREQVGHLEALQGGIHFYDIIGFFLPYFNYPFSALSSYFVDYLYILPVFLFIIAFSLKKKPKFIVFFSFLFLFGLITALNNSPLFWLIHHLPVINLLHEASRWMLIASFSLAVLAGFGLDMVLKNFEDIRKSFRAKIALRLFKWASILIALASVASSIAFYAFKNKILSVLNSYFDNFIYPSTAQFSLEYYHDYIAKLFYELTNSFSIFNPQFLAPFIFIITGYVFVRLYIAGKFQSKQFAGLITLIIILNFIGVFSFNDNIQPRSVLYKEPETVKFLHNQEDGRIFSFLRFFSLIELGDYNNSQDKSVLKSALLFPNKNIPFKIESVDYEGDPMINKSMAKLVNYIGGAASLPNIERLENLKLSPKEKVKIFESRKPIADFLNVRYLLSSGPINEEIFPKVFETVVTSKKIPIAVYENEQARPLYYFTDEKWLINLDRDMPAEKLNQEFKESNGKITQEGIKLIERKNSLLSLQISIEETKLLVFSQNNLPGWKAYIDDNEVLIYDVGTVYMGVLVPKGQHKVSFEYSYWDIWKRFFNDFLSK